VTRRPSLKSFSCALALSLALVAASSARGQAASDDETRLTIERIHIGEGRVYGETRDGARPELTLDPTLSRAALKLLEQAHPVEGAAVLIDLKSSSLRVFAEVHRGGSQGSAITEARAPAASVFKLITTAALFENGGVRPSERVCIAGGSHSVERRHLDAPRGGPDVTCGTFSQALGFSRNAVYAQLATHRLARQDLVEIAERLGFNSNVPFDWPVPVGSLNVPYNDLEFARTATGFQGSTLSPLGAAYIASVIAQGGLAQRLHLVAPPETGSLPEAETPTRILKKATARRLTKMMEVTVRSGTSRGVFHDESGRSLLPGVRVAGKTGTLRPGSRSETTSWFVGFAPADKPEVVVSVMLENGAVWRQRAAEVARDLLRVYFHRKGMTKIVDPLAPPETTSE
jgi:cell division protein FtsI/penicillin-binding protein 2